MVYHVVIKERSSSSSNANNTSTARRSPLLLQVSSIGAIIDIMQRGGGNNRYNFVSLGCFSMFSFVSSLVPLLSGSTYLSHAVRNVAFDVFFPRQHFGKDMWQFCCNLPHTKSGLVSGSINYCMLRSSIAVFGPFPWSIEQGRHAHDDTDLHVLGPPIEPAHAARV